MFETVSYRDVLPKDVLGRYTFLETGSAAKIMKAIQPDEFDDLVEVLSQFTLTASLLLTRGGSRGPVPRVLDGSFEHLGWGEYRIDTYKRVFKFYGHGADTARDDPFGNYAEDNLVSENYQQGYSVDNVKGRSLLDVEWNPKDGNLDRDFAAYRAWHDEGLNDVAVLICRMHQQTRELADVCWQKFAANHPQYDRKMFANYSTTTTANFEKAKERVLRGDLGTCPILVIGIGRNTWDGRDWDGSVLIYNTESQTLEPRDALEQ